jgi:2-succinyl-5-enolpyruvyl-6-hydroxy-3-cyclohexene-1-carboxylate synthase
MNPSTALGHVLVDELARCGVAEAVLAPGSRSAPLALALHEADAAGRLRLHVRVDERSAAFLALGLAKASGLPVVVVTTSGTAAANLHPAVLEASASGVPLVVLTADRPPELRGTGANQTVDQAKLFGDSVRLFHEVGVPQARAGQVGYWRGLVGRAVAVARGTRTADPGPVHLNVSLREPLVAGPGDGPDWPESLQGRPGGAQWTEVEAAGATDRAAPRSGRAPVWPQRTLVVVGDAPPWLGEGVRQLSEAHGWPVVSEASGNARDGAYALRCGHLLLAAEEFMADHAPDRVLVVGHPTLHRGVTSLLARAGVEVYVVAAHARWADATRTAARVLAVLPPADARPSPGGGGAWLHAWTDADRLVSAAVDELLDGPGRPMSEPALARDLLAALPPGALLVAGSSMPVRDLCLARPRAGVTVLANRGAAGIDGTVSTAIGAALAWQRSGGGPAFALLGDLTFVHDAGGLLLGPDEPRPDLTVVVVNNDGGGIFGLLEPGDALGQPGYERVFGTPLGADLAALCGASGTPHTRVSTIAELLSVALDPRSGLQVVEVRTDRAAARALAAAVRATVADAFGASPARVTPSG